MNIIKVNYDNLYVKDIKKITPNFYCYKTTKNNVSILRIEVDAKLSEEKYFTDFMFEIYINDTLMTYITKGSPTTSDGLYYLEFSGMDFLSDPEFFVQLKGHYVNKNQTLYSFVRDPVRITNFLFVKNELVCSELLVCSDYIEYIYGYMHEGIFYLDRTGSIGSYSYSLPADTGLFGDVRYVDRETNHMYKWNGNTQQFEVLL